MTSDLTSVFNAARDAIRSRGGGSMLIKAPLTPGSWGLPYKADISPFDKDDIEIIFEKGAILTSFTSGKTVIEFDVSFQGGQDGLGGTSTINRVVIRKPKIQCNGGYGISNVSERKITDASITAATNQLSSTGTPPTPFTSADVGKVVTVIGANTFSGLNTEGLLIAK